MKVRFQVRTALFAAALSLVALKAAAQESQPNILVLIADDVGVEQFAPFGIGAQPAETPTLDALATRGMRFSHVWSQAMCSATRATLLSGRYGFRTGVGSGTRSGLASPEEPPLGRGVPREVHEDLETAVFPYIRVYSPDAYSPGDAPRPAGGLSLAELGLPAQLKRAPTPYSTAAIGKWHLATTENGWLEHARHVGFDFFSLLMLNEPESYFSWWENVDGSMETRSGYTPRYKVDDAINWIGMQGDQPWFLWVAFNLAHFPQHIPTVEHLDTSGIEPDEPRAALDVMIARLDQEIGRLLDGIDPATLENTVIVFVGDNGTTGLSVDPPFHPERAKFTLYEGGLRVPLIIAGPGIPQGQPSSALINTTDIYPTLLDLAGAPVPDDRPVDGVSMVPYFEDPATPSLRQWLYADMFSSEHGVRSGGYTVRDQRFKLLRIREQMELHDVVADPAETTNLLADGISPAEQHVVDRLQQIADELHASEDQL